MADAYGELKPSIVALLENGCDPSDIESAVDEIIAELESEYV